MSETLLVVFLFFFSSRRRHTRLQGDWSSDVCSADLVGEGVVVVRPVAAPVLPVAGGVVVPPVPWPMTAIGISKPTAAAIAIALTQIFEAMPPPLTAHIIPPKIALRM